MKTQMIPWPWFLALLLLVGCAGEKDPVLLEVGPAQIHLSEFQRAFDEIIPQNVGFGADSASARRFLQAYVDKTVLEQLAADSTDWLKDLEDRARDILESEMVQRMREEVYVRPSMPTDAKLREVYEKAKTRYHFRSVSFATLQDAQASLQAIREGAVFDRFAAHQSGGTQGGDVGWQTILAIPEPVIDVLAHLEPDGLGGPVHTPGRYWIVQLIEKAPDLELQPFEQLRDALTRRYRIDHGGLLLEEYNERLLRDYQYRTNLGEAIWLAGLLRESTKHIPRQYNVPRNPDGTFAQTELQDSIPWQTCPIPDADWYRIIATSTADTVTAILLLDHLGGKLQYTWPTFEDPKDVLTLARELMLDRIERAEAWAKEYDKRPDLVWKDRKQRNLILTRQFYRRFVLPRARPSVEEARAYFDAHAAEYGEPARRRCLQATFAAWDDAVAAQRIFLEVRDPARAVGTVRQRFQSANVSGPAGIVLLEGKLAPALERQLFRVPAGGVTDPIPVQNAFAVLRVEEAEEARTPPFEEVAEKVMEQLGEQKADSLFKALVAERRSKTPVRIHERVLRKVQFHPPTQTSAPAPGGTT
jgi:parvulin-like peptidyl-prolyl isomerase